VVSFFGGDDGGIRGKHEMDSGIRYQIGLEFGDIDVQSSVKSQRGGQRRDNLSDQSVQVGISRSFDVQISSTDIIDSFVI